MAKKGSSKITQGDIRAALDPIVQYANSRPPEFDETDIETVLYSTPQGLAAGLSAAAVFGGPIGFAAGAFSFAASFLSRKKKQKAQLEAAKKRKLLQIDRQEQRLKGLERRRQAFLKGGSVLSPRDQLLANEAQLDNLTKGGGIRRNTLMRSLQASRGTSLDVSENLTEKLEHDLDTLVAAQGILDDERRATRSGALNFVNRKAFKEKIEEIEGVDI